jgi:hypothetical protein
MKAFASANSSDVAMKSMMGLIDGVAPLMRPPDKSGMSAKKNVSGT